MDLDFMESVCLGFSLFYRFFNFAKKPAKKSKSKISQENLYFGFDWELQ